MGCGSTNETHDEVDANSDTSSMSWTEPDDETPYERGGECSGNTSFSTSWTTEFSTSAQQLSYDKNEINDYKYVYLKSFLSSKPHNLIQDCNHGSGCIRGDPYCQKTAPQMVEYYIRHPSHESKGVYTFENESPTEADDSNSSILGSVIDIASTVGSFYSPWASVGGAVIKFFIAAGSSSVQVDKGDYSSTREYLQWDIDMQAEWPDEECDSSAVEFYLDNNLEDSDSDNSFDLDAWVRHTFHYHKYGDRCVDSYCERPSWSTYEKTENWIMNTSTWQNVE